MADIIHFTSKNNLEKEIEELRVEISMTILEHDELLHIHCKNIEAAYFLAFGSLELQIYQVEMEWLRLRRKLELLIAARNHKLAPDLVTIEEQLDQEFLDYQEKLDEMFRKMNEALERSEMGVLSEEESQKHKQLYRQIVKQLHPDLNPNISEAQEQLFFKAVEAYEKGMTEVLEMIAETVSSPTTETLPIKDSLMDEKKRLEAIVKKIQNQIASIKRDFPYLFKEFMKDEETRMAHREELEQELDYYKEGIKQYETAISYYL